MHLGVFDRARNAPDVDCPLSSSAADAFFPKPKSVTVAIDKEEECADQCTMP